MNRSIPRCRVGGVLEAENLAAGIESVVALGAASFLPTRRWFGDKTRQIRSVDIVDSALVSAGLERFAPTIISILFEDSGTASYFLPLVVTLEALSEDAILGIIEDGLDEWRVVEALRVPRFHEWLLARLAEPVVLPSRHGEFSFEPTSVLPRYLSAARTGGSRTVTGEQSNTSIVYGEAAILKAFRKLQPGINPDIEIGAFLTERSGFQHVPPQLGSMHYRGQRGGPVSIAVLQTFVPSVGDAWTITLRTLASLVGTAQDGLAATRAFERAVQWAGLLGERTGQLHVALASDSNDAAFAPEPVMDQDIRSWRDALNHAGQQRRADLAGHPIVSSNLAMAALAEQQLAPEALERLGKGFDALRGTVKTRAHGDYHLGQVLQTVDGDAVILDFEGEPSRPIEERRLKTSPLKDVAGMLRSFTYARVATERATEDAGHAPGPRSLAAWERAARAAFLDAYRHEAAKAGVPLIPESVDAFQRATRAWEADKALYEIHYELNSRPDWLPHVLKTLAIS